MIPYFTKEMLAPCGLVCSLCRHALQEEDPCHGCKGPDEYKYEYCKTKCGIVICQKFHENGYEYCDECPDFPCEDVMEKETRYQSKYPLKESPLANLREMRKIGADAFAEKQKERWSCECGGIISVHTGVCSRCGKKAE